MSVNSAGGRRTIVPSGLFNHLTKTGYDALEKD